MEIFTETLRHENKKISRRPISAGDYTLKSQEFKKFLLYQHFLSITDVQAV